MTNRKADPPKDATRSDHRSSQTKYPVTTNIVSRSVVMWANVQYHGVCRRNVAPHAPQGILHDAKLDRQRGNR